MRFLDAVRLSITNTTRMRTRTILTSLSVAIGVASVILVSVIGDSGANVVSREIDKLGVGGISIFSSGTASTPPLYAQDAEIIKSIESVERISPVVYNYGGFRLNKTVGNLVICGVDRDFDKIYSIELLSGRMLNKTDVSLGKRVAVIDNELAESTYKRKNIVGKSILLNVSGTTESFEIVGVILSQSSGILSLVSGAIPDFAYIPYTTMNRLRNNNEITQFAVKCFSDSKPSEVGKRAVEKLSRVKHTKNGYSYENMSGYVDNMKSLTSMISLLLSAIAAISLCVAGIGIMNTMISSVHERRREIGICTAIGAQNRDITLCFLVEAVIISLFGGISGAIFGIMSSLLITHVIGISLVLSVEKLAIIILLSAVFGIVFAIIPAKHAAKLDPIAALRE